MKIKVVLGSIVLAIASTGCNSTADDSGDTVASNQLHCEYRTKLGTSIKKKVCVTTEQKKQQKLDAQRTRQALSRVRGAGLQDDGI